LNLDSESQHLLSETEKRFVRAGAKLTADEKEKVMAINAELASLSTQFDQNVLKEVNDKAVVFDSVNDLEGLSSQAIAIASEAAKAKGLEGKYVVDLLNTSGQPLMSSLKRREVRERVQSISLSRGNSGGDFDNRALLCRMAVLKAEHANLLGFDNHAAYSLSAQTAKTTTAVNGRLASLAAAAALNVRREASDLQTLINAGGGDFDLATWDWDFYTEKLRQERYDFDETQLKPYLELGSVLEKGAFFVAEKLYGLSFKRRTDLPVYHPDVKVWEVMDADGSSLALFVEDMFARASKTGGAWMNEYVPQSHLLGTRAVVGNHLNVPKPPEGEPALLTWDEVITLFHEFGHALHGIFSDVRYPSFSGTAVPSDFVEFPSQVNEMWADWPEVLANYARHYETGESMPKALLDKVLAASKFNQGFNTAAYLAPTIFDQALHQLKADQVPTAESLIDFETQTLKDSGLDLAGVLPRYRSTYFSHIAGGYSAGYYSYIWSEVLDADAAEWFKAEGGLSRESGDYFRKSILSRGGSADSMDLYRAFRGAEPDIQALLNRRGLNG
jgi:peptidyl-dipeptidase Dcp